jgi:hypothetical protein
MKLTKPLSLDDLCSNNYSFIEFFLKLDAYNELRGCESIWALVLATIITIILFITDTILQTAYDFIGALVPLATASIALIGFLFAGLALMSAIISIKTINVIDKDGNIKSIAGILFSFYYCGGIIISSLFFSIVLYLYIRLMRSDFININTEIGIIPLVFFVIYTYMYSIIYTVALLGACLKLFFLNIKYENQTSSRMSESLNSRN